MLSEPTKPCDAAMLLSIASGRAPPASSVPLTRSAPPSASSSVGSHFTVTGVRVYSGLFSIMAAMA